MPKIANIAERILAILLSSAYRKNSLTAMQLPRCGPDILSALQRCIGRGQPVQITVLAFPFKVPNPAKVGNRTLPDFAEFAAICQCAKLRAAIQRVYPPGLEFHILHDGSLMADVFGIEIDEVREYEKYFRRLVQMIAPDFVRCHDFGELQQRSALDPSGAIDELRSAAETWFRVSRETQEWKNAFRKTLGMINLRSFPAATVAGLLRHATAGRLPCGWGHVEHRVHTAMMRYHVADAVIHQFDPRPSCFADAIHATTQERQGRLALWMVRRGQSLLPWHGIGCVDEGGRPRVAHAVEVYAEENYRPIFVQNEPTPFAFSKSDRPANLGFQFIQ